MHTHMSKHETKSNAPDSEHTSSENSHSLSELVPFDLDLQQTIDRRIVTQFMSEQKQALDNLNQPQQQPIQKKANNTGLPDHLKTGLEHLSGMDLSDVKVHYNSDKPKDLHALAYAQGNNIYLGPGQEKHLPHEAWHVVQQKQGRVKPTMQFKGVGINDNMELEKEADVMGQRANNFSADEESNQNLKSYFMSTQKEPVQRVGKETVQLMKVSNIIRVSASLVKTSLSKVPRVIGPRVTATYKPNPNVKRINLINKRSFTTSNTPQDTKLPKPKNKPLPLGIIPSETMTPETTTSNTTTSNTMKSNTMTPETMTSNTTTSNTMMPETMNLPCFPSKESLEAHYKKHAPEFEGRYKTPEAYEQGAREVIWTGTKIEYLYKGKPQIGFYKYVGKTKRGKAKYWFVPTDESATIIFSYFVINEKYLRRLEKSRELLKNYKHDKTNNPSE